MFLQFQRCHINLFTFLVNSAQRKIVIALVDRQKIVTASEYIPTIIHKIFETNSSFQAK